MEIHGRYKGHGEIERRTSNMMSDAGGGETSLHAMHIPRTRHTDTEEGPALGILRLEAWKVPSH